MMEMHSFKKTPQVVSLLPEKQAEVTAKELFCFLSELCEWSQSCPLVYRGGLDRGKVIYLLFRDFAFSGDDFWQTFGQYFYVMNSRWKLDVFGTAYPSQETVWLTLEEKDGQCYGIQNTVSGKEVDTIHSFCLTIECGSCEEAHILQNLFRSDDWRKGIIVADWKYHQFFEKENIENHWENSCFCYGSLFEEVEPSDYLHALTLEQKVTLWTGFLENGFDYKEFEWLYLRISERAVENRVEWELALHIAMQNLRYTIRVSERGFELYDAQSERKYFNFNSRQYAQMAFLKILFPVNI